MEEPSHLPLQVLVQKLLHPPEQVPEQLILQLVASCMIFTSPNCSLYALSIFWTFSSSFALMFILFPFCYFIPTMGICFLTAVPAGAGAGPVAPYAASSCAYIFASSPTESGAAYSAIGCIVHIFYFSELLVVRIEHLPDLFKLFRVDVHLVFFCYFIPTMGIYFLTSSPAGAGAGPVAPSVTG